MSQKPCTVKTLTQTKFYKVFPDIPLVQSIIADVLHRNIFDQREIERKKERGPEKAIIKDHKEKGIFRRRRKREQDNERK